MVTIAVPSLRQLNRSLRTARQDLKRRVAARLVSDRDYLERLYRREFGRDAAPSGAPSALAPPAAAPASAPK